METILFVHGTGVRTTAFETTLALITRKAQKHLRGYRIVGCNWGEVFGAKLNDGGRSIPDYTDAGATSASIKSSKLALWSLLAEDPLLEVRITEVAEHLIPQGFEIWGRVMALDEADEATELLRAWDLGDPWLSFIKSLKSNIKWKLTVTALRGSLLTYADVMARAVTAAFFAWLQSSGSPGLTGKQREQLESVLVVPLGGEGLGIGSWFLGKLTDYAVQRRGSLSDASGPAVGDILRYQARGDTLRNFIGEQAMKANASVILAHSLGGVAAVDWLAMGARGIRALVTVGSQAPYFYEIDALTSLPFSRELPDCFPKKWLNFFDPRDLLSYRAQEIFRGRAMDVRVDNGQPFPESHSAYWHNDTEVWPEIGRVIDSR